jgi:hypothetical protein
MLLPAAIALVGCGSRDAVEDPSPPVPAVATAIASAAPGARGAQFNSPGSAPPTAGRRDKGQGPLQPYESPLDEDDPQGGQEPQPEGKKQPAIPDAPDEERDRQDADGGRPPVRPHKSKGVSL